MSSVIVFPHLTYLTIVLGNIDNTENFLVDINKFLPLLIDLTIPIHIYNRKLHEKQPVAIVLK